MKDGEKTHESRPFRLLSSENGDEELGRSVWMRIPMLQLFMRSNLFFGIGSEDLGILLKGLGWNERKKRKHEKVD